MVGDCLWTDNDSFCDVLQQAAVPLDNKWPLVILYLRGIRDVKSLSEVQKSRMQELLLSVLRTKDYSQARYDEVQLSIQSIITLSYQEKLNEVVRQTSELAKDVHGMFGRHRQEVSTVVRNVDEELAKGADPALLLSGIRDALKDVVAKMEQDVSVLASLSHKDSLTGLANRRSFDAFLDECVERWNVNREPVSLIMFDIDHFKKFNDTYGHLVGDQVLRTLAAQVRDIAASLEDGSSRLLAARYGGEEFVMLLCGKAAGQSLQIAERLRKTVQKTSLLLRDADGQVVESGLRVTISLGIADIWPKWGGSFQTNLVDSADKALYHAKHNGRNCTVRHTPEAAKSYTPVPKE